MDIKRRIDEMKTVLDLDRKIVGIKFARTKEEFEESDVSQLKNKLSYCNMVKFATKGRSFKADFDNFYCVGSLRTFGLVKKDEEVTSGRVYYGYNMYKDIETAKNVQENVTYLDEGVYGLIVQPLEKFDENPDIVLMIVNPYQSMRIVQGYAYHYGNPKSVKLTGNQGICSECTATPYTTDDLNISLLCANTRFAAKWEQNEMGVGMPFNKFMNVTDGVLKTINPSDPNVIKKEILERAEKNNIDIDLELGTSYYRS
jgi:uncharacterized protein (DUF169 family)